MKKISTLLFFLCMGSMPSFSMDIKVSDQYPTLIELSGTIEKISFGNGDKAYTAKEEGRFLEIKAKAPQTSKTTITVYYLVNEGKKNEKVDVFFGTVSYDSGIQPFYDLTKNKEKKTDKEWDAEEALSEILIEAVEYIEKAPPNIKRFYQTKQKISCLLTNMVSTGEDIVLKFVFKNDSPYNYKLGKVYFLVNNKEKTAIPIKLKPRSMAISPGKSLSMVFAIQQKVENESILALFEEKKGRRDMSLKLPNRLLLNIPCFRKQTNE